MLKHLKALDIQISELATLDARSKCSPNALQVYRICNVLLYAGFFISDFATVDNKMRELAGLGSKQSCASIPRPRTSPVPDAPNNQSF